MDTGLNFAELRRASHWSFSALNSILNICSLQYAFGRIYKQPSEFTPINLVFGKAFHRGASFIYNNLKAGVLLEEVELNAIFEDSLELALDESPAPVNYGKDKDFDWYLAKGEQMLLTLQESVDPEEKIIGTDIPFQVDLKDVNGRVISKPLIGEYDAVVEKDGQTIVVDFKTAAAKWPAQKCHSDMQATAYLYALRQNYPGIDCLFRYDVITKTKAPSVTRHMTDRTESDFERLMKLVSIADQIVEHELYYPHEGCFSCSGCQYQSACAEWSSPRQKQQKQLEMFAA